MPFKHKAVKKEKKIVTEKRSKPPKDESSKQSKKSKKKDESNSEDEGEAHAQGNDNMDEMLTNGILYLLSAHAKMAPVKRADIVKFVIKDRQSPGSAFLKEFMESLQFQLNEVFGIEIYGLIDTTNEIGIDMSLTWTSYMIAGMFSPVRSFRELESSDPSSGRLPFDKTEAEAAIESILFLILTVILMSSVDVSIGIKEDTVWRIVETLQLHNVAKVRRQEFTKFAKVEYVTKKYLRIEETKDQNELNEPTTVRYFWGPRAQIEFSKKHIKAYVQELMKNAPGNQTIADQTTILPDQTLAEQQSNEDESMEY